MISGHILYSEMVNMKKIESFLVQAHWEKCVTHNSKLSHNKDCFLYRSSKSLFKVLEKNGVVVFTLGSMVKNLTEEKSKMIASALAQLPQKVRYLYFLREGQLF